MRRRAVLIAAAVVVALAPSLAESQAPAQPEPLTSLQTDSANPPLPPRAVLRIGTNDLRTRASISAFTFSPDGRFFAAADLLANEWGVVIWDVQTGRKVKQIVAPGKVQLNIRSLAFSPDGTELLWGEHDGDVVLWDLPGNRLLKRDKLYEEGTSAVAFSPDGSLMAIAGVQAIQLRKVASPGDVVRELDTQPDRTHGDAANPAASRASMVTGLHARWDSTRGGRVKRCNYLHLARWRWPVVAQDPRRTRHARGRVEDCRTELRGGHSRRPAGHVDRSNRGSASGAEFQVRRQNVDERCSALGHRDGCADRRLSR